jgi:hypothetical protein
MGRRRSANDVATKDVQIKPKKEEYASNMGLRFNGNDALLKDARIELKIEDVRHWAKVKVKRCSYVRCTNQAVRKGVCRSHAHFTMHLQCYFPNHFPKLLLRSSVPFVHRRHLPGIRVKKLKSQQKVMLTEEVWYKKELY